MHPEAVELCIYPKRIGAFTVSIGIITFTIMMNVPVADGVAY